MRAKPLHAFRLGNRKVIVCRLEECDDNPMRFIGNDFLFRNGSHVSAKIRIEGVSTAGDAGTGVFDFCYSGDEILTEQIGDKSVISDDAVE